MKEFKGTPGPWVVHGTTIYVAGGGFDVRNMPKAEENAQLIAAAPELLEALQKIIYKCETPIADLYDLLRAINDAKPAIAKALGETK